MVKSCIFSAFPSNIQTFLVHPTFERGDTLKRLISFLMLALLLFPLAFGCRQKDQPSFRFVTQLDIYFQYNDIHLQRHYTTDEKIEAVLLYMRLLHTEDAPVTDPEAITSDTYTITVSFSDGSQQTHIQKAHRYFRRHGSGWQTIQPRQAAQLYALMRHYPSDSMPTA